MSSNLTPFGYIAEGSEATPGLFNTIFSALSTNIAAVNASSASMGAAYPSGTSAIAAIYADSRFTDYLYLKDTSNQRSNYIIGSHLSNTADGLNIWDDSGQTMIATFSKQSIRFYQSVVGPVFDVGGALANTLNAATFGSGSDSKESRIQAAISAATAQSIARVYIPASMYPYSAGSVSFATSVQMVREGGAWNVYDAQAYGANNNGVADTRAALQATLDAVVGAGGGTAFLPLGTYALTSYRPSTGSDRLLQMDGGSGGAISVVLTGDPGTIITTSLSTTTTGAATLILQGNLSDCQIQGLVFRNTHAVTPNRTTAIDAEGGASNTVKRLTIRQCTFRDHSRTLAMAGVEGLVVEDNQFLYTNGRDSGSTTISEPNVGMWCFVQDTGQTSSVRVTGNYFDGCVSGSVSTAVTQTGLDGFVYGASRGWYIAGNVIRHNGVEAIYISHRNSSSADSALRFPAIIANNIIDSTIPTGGQLQSYGIRSDEHDTTVIGNRCHNVLRGILVTQGAAVSRLTGTSILGNYISVSSNATADTPYGISCNAIEAPLVANNRIEYLSGASSQISNFGFNLFQAHNIKAYANTVFAAPSSTTTIYGWWVQQTHSGRFVGNHTENVSHGFTENQHPSGGTGNIVDVHYFRNDTNTYTGDIGTLVVRNYDGPWPNGSSVTPAFSFASDISMGWYRSAASNMALSSGSLQIPGNVQTTAGWVEINQPANSNNQFLRLIDTASNGETMVMQLHTNNVKTGRFYSITSGVPVFNWGVDQNMILSSGLHLASGSATTPGVNFSSETSLGWYRSGISTMALSSGYSLNLNQSRLLSIRTSASASVDSTKLAAEETTWILSGNTMVLTVRTGGNVWTFNSSTSTKG